MNFTSQICTTKDQSERLLALGLKKETADMGLAGDIPISIEDWKTQDTTLINSPAWSLHRLIELCAIPEVPLIEVKFQNTYDEIISLIAEAIKFDVFNKEYLEE